MGIDRGRLEELKKLRDEGVIDDSAYQRAVDKEIDGKESTADKVVKSVSKANRTVVGLVAIAIVVAAILLFWATVGSKPAGISERDYGLAKEAISVAESYLNGSMSASRAYECMDDIDSQINDLGISIDVQGLKIELMNGWIGLGETVDESVIREKVVEIKRSIGYLA